MLFLIRLYRCEVSSSRIVNRIFFVYVEELSFKYNSLRFEIVALGINFGHKTHLVFVTNALL